MSYILGVKEFTLVEDTPLVLVVNGTSGSNSYYGYSSILNTENDVDYLYVSTLHPGGPPTPNLGRVILKINMNNNSITNIFTVPSLYNQGSCFAIWIDSANQKLISVWRYTGSGDDTFYVHDYNGNVLQTFASGYYGDTFQSLDYDSKRGKLLSINVQYSKIHLLDYNGAGTAGTSGNMYITSIDSGYMPPYVSGGYGISQAIYDKELDKILVTPYPYPNNGYLPIYTHDPSNLSSYTTTDYDRSIINGLNLRKDADKNVYVITTGKDPNPLGGPLLTIQSLVLIDQITLKTVFRYDEPIVGNGFAKVTVDNKRNRFILHNGNYLRFYNKVLI